MQLGEHGEVAFGLRGRSPVTLHATGVRHPRTSWLGTSLGAGEVFTPYADLTHVVAGPRGLRIASRRRSVVLARGLFEDPLDVPRLVAAVRARVSALPGGAERRARMERLDERLARPATPWVARGLAAACIAVFALQVWTAPRLELAGLFSSDLVRAGELWRLVTANFLHGGAAHLTLNVIGLLILGTLLELALGSRAALFVAGVSGLGAMVGSLVGDYFQAVGASGIVAGFVGGLLWLELRRPELLAAPWRLPRGLLLFAVGADAVGLALVPNIAHWAHAGGLAAGLAATVAVLPPRDATAPPAMHRPTWLTAANAALGAAALASVLALAGTPGTTAARMRGERLLSIEGIRPEVLNNEAWMIATTGEPDRELLLTARRLAERAVEDTGRGDPNILDTLAEVYFQLGREERAVQVIEEAIALEPDEPYFHEQRRRFLGERAPDDRPAPPEMPEAVPPAPRPPGPAEEPPAIRV